MMIDQHLGASQQFGIGPLVDRAERLVQTIATPSWCSS